MKNKNNHIRIYRLSTEAGPTVRLDSGKLVEVGKVELKYDNSTGRYSDIEV